MESPYRTAATVKYRLTCGRCKHEDDVPDDAGIDHTGDETDL